MIDVDILVILDRSGSMQDAKSDHEGGLTSFVEDQRGLAGDVRFTLAQFDSQNPCEILYDRTPIADVGAITLIPRGGTPLLDAIGRAVSHLEERQSVESADKTVVMVITDGEENSSLEWTKARVAERVKALEAGRWTFLFLGANIDTFAEAGSLNIPQTTSLSFDNANPHAVRAAYAVTSLNMRRARSMGGSAFRAAMTYTAAQRASAVGAYVAPDEQPDEKKEE